MRRILSAAVLCVALVLPAADTLAAPAPPAPQLPVMKVPLVAWVTSRQHARPETLQDFTVDPTRLAQFRALLGSILNENWSQAHAQAKSLAYLLVAIEETGNWFVIASDDSNTGRDPTVVNLPDDVVYGYRKLCGYTNVQGRQVNGGADACHGSVDQGGGQFIHIEQDWTVLRPYARSGRQTGPHRFGTALMRALARVLPRVQAP
jgi:hypothetical protein